MPISEDHPLDPISAYGESKLMFERCLAWYNRAYGMKAIALRYFNAAGATSERGEARRDETHLIPLVFSAIQGKRDGTSAVDYTVNASMGVPLITGPSGHEDPVNHVLPAWDLITGQMAATGLLAVRAAS